MLKGSSSEKSRCSDRSGIILFFVVMPNSLLVLRFNFGSTGNLVELGHKI